MKVHGSCHCRRVRYEADIDPEKVGICNCSDCQMLTGTAFRVVAPASRETFQLLSGDLTVYVKTADSGAKRRHSFCSHCGTPVHATAETDRPATYTLRIGCLEERALLPAKRRIWCKSALAWAQNVSLIPGIDGQ